MKSLIQMESLWHDGLYIKIYNKFLNVQVNKATFFFLFFLPWNLFRLHSGGLRRPLFGHPLWLTSDSSVQVSQWWGSYKGYSSAYQIATFLTRVCKTAKQTVSFMSVRLSVHPYVRPHGTTRLPLDGFQRTLISVLFFSKICRENSVSLKFFKNNGYFTRRRFHINDNVSLNSS
jgi:hypothetical protein